MGAATGSGQKDTADYMVVDLSAGSTASNYPVAYLSAVPAGGWSDDYKTILLVLRRIPAGTFMMGSPVNELGGHGSEVLHRVTLTRPFYIGVFEVTQRQWERVMGTWPSYFTNASCRDSRPVETVGYQAIRGSKEIAGWPANGKVDEESFMGRLRARTGKAFDLPTESQWEYTGRAGTTTALNSGKNVTATDRCPNMSEVGRYWQNGGYSNSRGEHSSQNGDASVGSATVGSYQPNAWGLYDFHGNVWEWCLDWYGIYPGTVRDPVGPLSGKQRVFRGGSWHSNADTCRIANCDFYPDFAHNRLGFRAAIR
jgi:formylglycine-generating enzyme required for sulfatase activity